MKIAISTILILSAILLPQGVFAQAAELSTPITDATYHKQTTFTVPVLLRSPGIAVNAFDVTVSYPENIQFIGSDEGGSIVTLWVEKPIAGISNPNTTVSFSGTIPTGFTEIQNPLTKTKSPGLLTKLIFKTNTEGVGEISGKVKLYADDGQGTLVSSNGFSLNIAVDAETEATKYVWTDTVLPEVFTPAVMKDELAYNGKYVLVFNAIDKDSGISTYEVREGDGKWKNATSPFLLRDQGLHSTIVIRATDKAGNVRMVTIPAPNGESDGLYIKLITYVGIILILSLVFVVRKRIFKVQ
ncbi:MAG: hypothetical protein KBB70_01950 [Candidatus Pacebacteria bacterium]|nr:hypothetical protein [Candidatus Paceibacterota bacterium]